MAEVFEGEGRLEDAKRFAAAELDDVHNFTDVSKCRAHRTLARCHAAAGETELAVAAFDCAMQRAQVGRYLLQEALAVRGRAVVVQAAGDGPWGCHDEALEKLLLAEVMGRMKLDADGKTELETALLRIKDDNVHDTDRGHGSDIPRTRTRRRGSSRW